MPIFAFPAVLTNIGHGQNGFLSAALFGGGALWLDRRPILAGLGLGALGYQPHLGYMIPIALAVAGRWKTFAAAGASVVALAATSYSVFGAGDSRASWPTPAWPVRRWSKTWSATPWMQSAFAAVRPRAAASSWVTACKPLSSCWPLAGLVWLHRRAPRGAGEGPAMIVAALLASPFLLDYDLVILAAPLAWMLREGAGQGFSVGKRPCSSPPSCCRRSRGCWLRTQGCHSRRS